MPSLSSPPTPLSTLLRPTTPRFVTAAALAVLSGLCGLAALLALCEVIATGSPAPFLAAVALWIAEALLAEAGSWLAHRTEAALETRLRRHLADHILRLPAATWSHHSSGRLRRAVDGDVTDLHHLLAHLPSDLATMLVVPVVALVCLIVTAGPTALLAVIPAAFAAVCHLVVIPRIGAAYDDRRVAAVGGMVTAADDYARGARIHRLYGAEAGAAAGYREATRTFSRAMVSWVNRVAPPAAVATALLQAAATLAVAFAVAHDRGTVDLARTLLLSLAAVAPALRLGHGTDHVRAGVAASRRLGELLNEPTVASGNATVPAAPAHLDVDLPGLRGRFPAGTLTAVTGPSGAGKSTLLRTVAGLETTDGTATVAGTPVGGISADDRPGAVLLVPQDCDVLPGTVRDNLLTSTPGATDAALRGALDRAAAPEVDLAAEATTLSGGERQRVTLARAFLTTAPVILLDEPTSALDAATAQRVVAELARLAHAAPPRCVVMVTHDPARAAQADRRVAVEVVR
jgi:ATP-binding cassette subfamily B protein